AFIYETNHSKSGLGLPFIGALVMVTDKSWTCLGRHEKAFYTGLKKFVEDCKPLVDSVGNIKCPCKSCRLVLWVSIENLSRHITNYRFDPSYKTWIHHGEPDLLSPPPVIDNTRQPQMSDMTACLNDLSYIPLNNEQNEPTQRDIGETSNEFEELYANANEELVVTILQRLYKSSHTAKEMTWHATRKCTKPGKMQHPVDGRAWKNFDIKYPDFAKEPRNVRLGLAADGFNPFGNLSQSYSMWPIDDLKDLWAKPGVETIDVATGQKLNMRAMFLWTINDFPARSSLSGWSGQGYKAYPTCNEDTPFTRVFGKTAYVGHRRFLKKPYKWRRSLDFNGEIKNRDPLRKFNRDDIMTQLARLPMRVKGKHLMYRGVKIKRNVHVELNGTKRSIFYELEYCSFLTLKHNLDVMHIKKNVLESILNTFLINDKSKDTTKARQDLKRLGIRSGLWLNQNKNEKCTKPHAAYSFTPGDRKKFCQFIKGVKLPDGFGSNFKHKVTDNDTNITGLKSHDCHIMMQRLLLYGLQQYLLADVAKPIIELCLFFKQICSQTLMEDNMLKAQSNVIDIMCNLELIYPPGFLEIMIHLVIHLPLEALEGRPIRPRWMYPFKRFIKKLKNYVRNKAKPEGSIADGYVAEEALTFSSHYFWDVTMKFNHSDRNVDFPPPTCQF
ncbi:zinc finger, PHD-type containing protein, partial [Tanacetum coccineum]